MQASPLDSPVGCGAFGIPPKPCYDIQTALDNAEAGTNVFVFPGKSKGAVFRGSCSSLGSAGLHTAGSRTLQPSRRALLPPRPLPAGIYSGPRNTALNFRGKVLRLQSLAGRDLTLINCTGSSRAFTFQSGETRATVVSGATAGSEGT